MKRCWPSKDSPPCKLCSGSSGHARYGIRNVWRKPRNGFAHRRYPPGAHRLRRKSKSHTQRRNAGGSSRALPYRLSKNRPPPRRTNHCRVDNKTAERIARSIIQGVEKKRPGYFNAQRRFQIESSRRRHDQRGCPGIRGNGGYREAGDFCGEIPSRKKMDERSCGTSNAVDR